MLRASEGAAANFQQSSWSLLTQHNLQVQQGLLSIEVVSKLVLVVAVVQPAVLSSGAQYIPKIILSSWHSWPKSKYPRVLDTQE